MELTVLTKTNGWPQSNSIQPTQLLCLPIPEEAVTYPAPKMAVIAITNPPKYPELATSYSHLWVGFANGITIPKTFVCMFSVLGHTIAHDYYRNMALGYITLWHIAAANTHHFDQDTLNRFLITLAVYQCQVPLLPRIWDQILSQLSNTVENDWSLRMTPCILPTTIRPDVHAPEHTNGPMGHLNTIK